MNLPSPTTPSTATKQSAAQGALRRIRAALFAAAFGLLAGVGMRGLAADTAASPASGPALVGPGDRILVFGDSISTGRSYGFQAVELVNAAHPDWAVEWIEHGHPGWTALDAVRLVDDVIARRPTVVTLMFGTNDLGGHGARGVAELPDRLRALVRPLRAAGLRVVLLTPPAADPRGDLSREWNRASLPRMVEGVRTLAEEEGVPVLDMFHPLLAAADAGLAAEPAVEFFMRAGDCHPNGRGHRLLGRTLADFLLGQPPAPVEPFAWTWTGQPEGWAAPRLRHVDAPPMTIDRADQINAVDSWNGPDDLSARVRAIWDDEALHLAADVTDDVVLAGAEQPAWGYDGIEFFFDTRPPERRDIAYAPGYFQLLVAVPAADGPAPVAVGGMDTLDPAAIVATARRTPAGYRLDVAVPWATLRHTPTAGGDVGFDFALNDRDHPDRERRKALWRGAGDDYANAGAIGRLRLAP